MTFFIIIIVVIAIILIMGAYSSGVAEREKKEKKAAPRKDEAVVYWRDEDEEFAIEYDEPIRGLNHAGITPGMVGRFYGRVRAHTNNAFDRYAVGVYVGHRRVGFLPAGNEEVHKWLRARGGVADAIGFIARNYDEEEDRHYYYGMVKILQLDPAFGQNSD